MDQQKIGETLKQLRKKRGLTQQQLADIMHTTNRSVSRWENGNNLPDISVLMELADYYEVELRDILAGNVKPKDMNTQEKETVLLVADYSDLATQNFIKRIHVLFIVSALGVVGSIILRDFEYTGPIWEFLQGLGIGLGLGSLIIGVIMTSKNAHKWFQNKTKYCCRKENVS